MPKFTYEVDTENRTTKAFIDGNEVAPYEFSIGCYKVRGCDDPIGTEYTQCYTSISHKVDDNSTMTYSYSFTDKAGDDSSYSEVITRNISNIAKQAAKSIGNFIAAHKLEKALLAKSENKH